ncbi:MAG: Rieske 2Fe-2S domain-containing protein [Acidimicrobiia bacterium]|nr:Rieske 2Fe-2S domain-containing protein [Acidimicrobiia bacterium]
MSAAGFIAIAIGAAVVLAALAFVTLAKRTDVRGAGALSNETRRRDRSARRTRPAEDLVERGPTADEVEAAGVAARHGTDIAPAEPAPLIPWSPPDPEAIGVSRRMFFNRASITLTSAGVGAFAAAGFVAFLWPTATGGFGQAVNVGKLDNILDTIRTGDGFFYASSARTWITEYPADAIPKARAVYADTIVAGMEQGVVALYQKCPHLGCRVPSCATSGWFECPCHGSQYNRVGEKKAGPAPRGMDRFPVTVAANGDVTVDTGTIVAGPAIGTNTTGQEAEGPHCITGSEEH